MVDKHKQKKKKPFKSYGKSNKDLNALIEKKFQKFVKNKKRRKNGEGASALSRNVDFERRKREECLMLCRERGKWRNLSLKF